MQQRNAANARERARMRVLSKAFIKLKTHLTMGVYLIFLLLNHVILLILLISDKRFHMIQSYRNLDTLRLATSYILHLSQILRHMMNLSIQPIAAPATTTTSLSLQAPNAFVKFISAFHFCS